MEDKKTRRADLERQRPQRLVLGLVVALAMLFVALEYTWAPDDDLDMEGLEDFIRDAELMAELPVQEDMVPIPVEEEKPKAPEQLNLVDEAPDELEEPPLETTPEVQDEAEEELQERDEPKPEEADEALAKIQDLDELPEFPGGAAEMMKWLTKNLRYPQSAQQRKVQGKVVTQFIVGTDGRVSDIMLLERLDPGCDIEALRVIRMMPRWKPGMLHQKPCRTVVCIPIVFRL